MHILAGAVFGAAIAIAGSASAGTSSSIGGVLGPSAEITFQARLADDDGTAFPDGLYVLDFFVYAEPEGGLPLASVLDQLVEVSGGDGVLTTRIPVESGWFDAAPRYLGLTVDDDDDDPVGDELLPRVAFTPVPFALRAFDLPPTTVLHVMAGSFEDGVDVGGVLTMQDQLLLTPPADGQEFNPQLSFSGGYRAFRDGIGDTVPESNGTRWWLDAPDRGEVHIGPRVGTNALSIFRVKALVSRFESRLRVWDDATFDADLTVGGQVFLDAPDVGEEFNPQLSFSGGYRVFRDDVGAGPDDSRWWLDAPDGGEVIIGPRPGLDRLHRLLVKGDTEILGTTRTSVLTITGGADLAESFPSSPRSGGPIRPGDVVAIDSETPGAVMISEHPYDARVAGVVSGANGLDPGLVLGVPGDPHVDGDVRVALTGRVWCRCDADANGPIRAGDMLTTSSVAGHAMRATDRERSFGAVLGKAMTGLEEGRGLVLVLVNLQ